MSVSADTFALKTEQQRNRLQTRFSMHDCEPKHRRGKDGEGASPKRTIPVSQAGGSGTRPGGDGPVSNLTALYEAGHRVSH